MATGLKALGAASAVIQLISFSGTIISQCIAIYNGRPTPNDSLGEYAKRLGDVARQVEARCGTLGPSLVAEESKVIEIARKCQSAAQDLQVEVEHLTKMQQKGQLGKAIYAVFKSSRHQNKLQRLEQNLIRHKEALETHILSHICTQTRAIDLQQGQEFQKFSADIQDVLQQIALGRTQLECLIAVEHLKTRTIIKEEIITAQERTEDHVSSELHNLSLATTTTNQQQKFLESLKFHDLNQRYNDIMEPQDATFERIFISYKNSAFVNDSDPSGRASCGSGDRTSFDSSDSISYDSDGSMRDIDQAWEEFIDWLQTPESIFWIRGKPGSGKSTLMKFIVNSSDTKNLLFNWNPEVIVLSHYFWKIGSQSQNSIKGLLCSLCHQILAKNNDIITYALNSQPHMSSKGSYHDWSLQEVKALLSLILDYGRQHYCIFVDGLDEVCDKEGPGSIMDTVTHLIQRQRVKVCVSSRPETGLVQRLEKLNSPGLKLELLTMPDMSKYVQQKLLPLLENEMLSASAYTKLVHELTLKADGVFLWLYLASKSIVDGASQGDSEEELLLRLQQIPGELEELYAEMWVRLNHNIPVYRQTAAELFHYALMPMEFHYMFEPYGKETDRFTRSKTPVVFQIGCARSPEIQDAVIRDPESFDDANVLKVCGKVENEVRIRCAELLEILPNEIISRLHREPSPSSSNETYQWAERLTARIVFIHRTAHDYLLNTEFGQRILGHKPTSSMSQKLAILRGTLCTAYILARMRIRLSVYNFLDILTTEASSNATKHTYQTTSERLCELNDAYDRGYIKVLSPSWYPRPHFLSLLTAFTHFDDFVISSLKELSSVTTTEEVLRDAWDMSPRGKRPSIRLVEEVMALGPNWHSYDLCRGRFTIHLPVQQGTAFTRLLIKSLQWRDGVFPDGSEAMSLLKIVLTMASTCPDLEHSTLVWAYLSQRHILFSQPHWWSAFDITSDIGEFVPFQFLYEVKLQFILRQLVMNLAARIEIPPSLLPQVREISASHEANSFRLRLTLHGEKSGEAQCWKILSQGPFATLNAAAFDYGLGDDNLESQRCVKIYCEYCELQKDSSIMEPVHWKDSFRALLKEGLDVCTFEDAGIPRPEPMSVDEYKTGW